MKLVLLLRVDDVPWRQVPAGSWSVADVARLVEESRALGLVFSVLPSQRTLTAFSSFADFVLAEGHRLVSDVPPDVRVESVVPGTQAPELAAWVKSQADQGWVL